MITLQKYEDILSSGLILDHYFLLCNIRDGYQVPKNRRIHGFINLLTKRGYILEGILTEVAIDLLNDSNKEIVISTTTTTSSSTGATNKQLDFDEWVISLYRKCQERIFNLMGSRQVRAKIKGGKTYPFLCNNVDLRKVLIRMINTYKLKDYEGIERCMLAHIDRCGRDKDWFPLMKYYVMKDGQSTLVTDLESPIEEEEKRGGSTQKFV